ncbi:MAG: TadE family protein [Actinomycetota bacterium]
MDRRRDTKERGATMVESAIITPVLLLLIFAIFEFGFAFRNYLTIAHTVRDGAREASIGADSGDADHRMLEAVASASAALPDGSIDRIVIWRATGPHDDVPSGCTSGSGVTGLCNVYTTAAFDIPAEEFGCQLVSNGDPYNSLDRFWCPTGRNVTAGSGLDFVGIHIQITHDYITGLFGDQIVFTDQIILKVEPQENTT